MKIKRTIEGKEVEIEVSQTDALEILKAENADSAKGKGILKALREKLGITDDAEDEAKKKGTDPVVLELMEQVKTLSGALNEEKKARENATATIQAQQKAQREKEIGEIVTKAVKEGRIVPADEAKWKGRLEKDFETTKEVLAEISGGKTVQGKETKTGKEGKKGGPGSETFSVADYLANPAKYSALAQAEMEAGPTA